jgi:predicted nucleic-acid-binding protein
MQSLDTNLVFRLIVLDDEVEQSERAALVWQCATAGAGVFLSVTVLVELAWVLRTVAKQDRATIAGALFRLVDSMGVTTEREPIVRRALESYQRGSADFSDYIILESSRDASALPVLTFDQRFAREPGVQLPEPQR